MIEDKDSLSFGRYLKSIRFEKGISLEEISNETKIRMDIRSFLLRRTILPDYLLKFM